MAGTAKRGPAGLLIVSEGLQSSFITSQCSPDSHRQLKLNRKLCPILVEEEQVMCSAQHVLLPPRQPLGAGRECNDGIAFQEKAQELKRACRPADRYLIGQ